ncbi:MAG: DNA polymerase III subunit gamma/tau [Firmicutes bacterium]|nr:DNA polymerase III subunit gamma/tau [Bacillota bacterium]
MAGYEALYRRWRPRRFADVVGQEHVTRALRHAVAQGRVAHAYLFCGPRGTGKTSVARILAQALLCRQPQEGEPCGACERCAAFGREGALDVLEIDAASNRGIDEIRELRERLGYAPSGGGHKVYIVDEVHMLTEPAFNALLKTLEEPPPFVVFVLATTEPRKVPPTVASRCQRFDFRRLPGEAIRAQLEKIVAALGASADAAALEAIALRADGGLRDALSLLDQCLVYADGRLTDEDVAAVLGTATREELEGLADAVEQRDTAAVWEIIDRLHGAGRDLAQVVRDLIEVWRGRARGAQGAEARRAVEILQGLLTLEGELRRGASPRVTVEVGLVRLAWAPEPAEDAAAPMPSRRAPASAAASSAPAAASSTPAAASAAAPRPSRRASQPAEDAPAAAAPAPAPAPAPSPAPRAAAEAPPAPAEAVSLATVVARWDDVMKAVRKWKVGTHALLTVARPGAVEAGELILLFTRGYTFHKDQVAREEHRTVLERALRSVLGAELRVRCEIDESGAPPTGVAPQGASGAPGRAAAPERTPGSAGAQGAAGRGGPDAPAAAAPAGGPEDDPLVRAVLQRFGGEIVEVREMDE